MSIDSTGQRQELVSGHDEWIDRVDQVAAEKQLGRSPHTLMIARHVEAKFAMMMRDRGVRDAALAINNRPCSGRNPTQWGCHDLLPRLLAADSRLTIYGPDGFQHTYISEETTDDR